MFIRESIGVDVFLRMFRPPKPTLSSKESIVLEKIPSFFLQIHKSSLPLLSIYGYYSYFKNLENFYRTE